MTVLTTFATTTTGQDARDTLNAMLADIAALKASTVTPTPTPTVSLSAAQSKNEGNSGATVFTYTVTRSSTSGAVNVPWSFTAGGTSADDFTGGVYPAGGTVALASGVASGTFSVSVNGDTVVEGDETFTVLISTPSGYVAGSTTSATGTILNDDVASGTPVVAMFSQRSVPPKAAYGYQRVVTGYTGPLYRLVGGQSGGTYDVVQDSNGRPNFATLAAWVGNATDIRVDVWYDQSGNGHNATQTDATTRPYFDTNSAYFGRQPVGVFNFGNFLNIPATLSINTGKMLACAVVSQHRMSWTTGAYNAIWQIGGPGQNGRIGESTSMSSGATGAGNGITLRPNGDYISSDTSVGFFPATQPNTLSFFPSDIGNALWWDTKGGLVSAQSPGGTVTGGYIGRCEDHYGGSAFFAFAVFELTTTANNDDGLQFHTPIDAAARQEVGWTDTPAAFLMAPGNSIVGGVGSRIGRTYTERAELQMTKRIRQLNMGIPGQSAAAVNTANKALYLNRYDSSYPVNVMLAPEPTNDIDAGSTDGAALWAANLAFINEAIAKGFKVLVPTTIKRAWGTDVTAKEAARTAYNNSARNSLPAGAYVVDFAADDANITLVDAAHPNDAGHTLMGNRLAAALSAII